jgi:hypothetical protein
MHKRKEPLLNTPIVWIQSIFSFCLSGKNPGMNIAFFSILTVGPAHAIDCARVLSSSEIPGVATEKKHETTRSPNSACFKSLRWSHVRLRPPSKTKTFEHVGHPSVNKEAVVRIKDCGQICFIIIMVERMQLRVGTLGYPHVGMCRHGLVTRSMSRKIVRREGCGFEEVRARSVVLHRKGTHFTHLRKQSYAEQQLQVVTYNLR